MEQDQGIISYKNALIAIMDDGNNPDATKRIPNTIQYLKEFLDTYNGNIPLNFAITSTKEALYGDNAEEKGISEFSAAMHRSKNLVVLNASQLHSQAECIESLRHEVLGHYGLLTFNSEEKIELLNEVLKTRHDPALKEIWEAVDANYQHLNSWDYAPYHKAEEVFAFVAQKPELFFDNCWNKVRAACAKILRKCGLISQDITAVELRVEALKISEGIRNGEREQKIFPENDRILFKKSLEEEKIYSPVKSKEHESPTKKAAIRDTIMSQAEILPPEAQIDENEECTVKPTRQRDLNAPGGFTDSISSEEENPAAKARGLPEFVQKNFLEVNGDFYFHNREPAFSFKNDEFKTKANKPEVVKAIVAIAKEQDWSSITVTGNKDFRRSVWLEAASQGIEVNGYTPTEVEKAQAAKMAERNRGAEQENTVREDKAQQAEFEQRRSMSEASRESTSDTARDKAQAFKEGDKAEVLKQFPDLAKAYGTVSVAEKFAQKNLEPEQAQVFVRKVQEAYAEKIENGEDLPAATVKRSAILRFLDRFRKDSPEPEKAAQAAPEPEKAAQAAPEPEKAAQATPEPEKAAQATPEPEKAAQATPEPEKAAQAAPEPEKAAQAVKHGEKKVANYLTTIARHDTGYSAFDTMFNTSYLSGSNAGQTFVQMLEHGGMSKERAILVAEVSKVKEGLSPEVFAKEMAENKRMFESLAKESTQEKCRVLAMMYVDRMERLRYNDNGEINHAVTKALHNRQNKIREGLDQRREAQMLDAAQKPASPLRSPSMPGNPQQKVDLENRQQFVAYLQKAGVEAPQAERLYAERQNRKVTDPKTYAKEISFERQQIAEMQRYSQPSQDKALAINAFVAENIQKNSDAAKARESSEQEKFVQLMEKNGIAPEKAQVIYEARNIQKELAPEDFAHNMQLQKNVVGQCKTAKLSPADTEKRLARLLEDQYGMMKERASRDPAARDIISRAEAGRMQEIQQERAQRDQTQPERQMHEPQARTRATSRSGRGNGGR